MKQTILGKTGLEVSPLCIGTWQLAGPVTFDGQPDGHPDPGKTHVLRLIRELFDRGLNFIDTAEQYGGGEAERRIGEALAPDRDQWVISTKFGYRVGPGNARIDDSSPGTISSSIEGSLKRLRTDYLDIFLYHCAPERADLPEALAILEKARADGKVRFFGISGGDLGLIQALQESDLLDVLQFPVSMLDPQPGISAFVEKHGTGTQLRGIMAQGRLTGKYFSKKPTWHADDNRTLHIADEDLSQYERLQAQLPEGMTLAQAAIQWALKNPAHHSICLGAKNLPDYEAAIAALEMEPLSSDTFSKLETIAQELS
jgi:aryl-alcohol dehydrogenase-like predicted oxidoreductase